MAVDGADLGTRSVELNSADRVPDNVVADLFTDHQSHALRSCARTTRDHDLAEDAVQDAFLQVLQRVRDGDRTLLAGNPAGVVRRNARWAASKLKARRRAASDKVLLLMDATRTPVPDLWFQLEMRWEVEAILARLPEEQREVLRLRFWEALPDADSADRLGVSIKAFRCRLDRALLAARVAARELRRAGALVLGAGATRLRAGGERTRARLQRAQTLLQTGGDVAMPLMATAVPAVLALAIAGQTGIPGFSGRSGAAGIGGATPPGALAVGPPGSGGWHGAIPAGRSAPPGSGQTGGNGGAPPAGLLPMRPGAASETPEDTVFYAVAAAPDHRYSHAVVALGYGRACACPVMFQSLDDGATWTPTNGPPAEVDQIVLPPTYPQDGRIFLGSPATGQSPDYWTLGFGKPFQVLPAPPGELALSTQFGRGDDRVFVAAAGSAWSYDAASGVSVPLLLDRTVTTVQGVGSTSAGGTRVFVLGSALAGAALDPVSLAGNPTNGLHPGYTLFECPSSQNSCTSMSTVTMTDRPRLLVSSAGNSPAILVYDGALVMRSSGDGRQFQQVSGPPGNISTLTAAPSTHGGALRLWSVTWTVSGGDVYLEDGGISWVRTYAGQGPSTPVMQPTTLGRSGLLVMLAGGGFVCTGDNGQHWARRCP